MLMQGWECMQWMSGGVVLLGQVVCTEGGPRSTVAGKIAGPWAAARLDRDA